MTLTRERGLYGWSIRDLVAAVGTSPTVVYRRVGGRDALCRRVVEAVLKMIEEPDDFDVIAVDADRRGDGDWGQPRGPRRLTGNAPPDRLR
ncbi:hypothetical protein ID554_13860 [Micromonospora craniellae]|nr:hypothetical protein ID554_13860 [Micromonospora craniellae]